MASRKVIIWLLCWPSTAAFSCENLQPKRPITITGYYNLTPDLPMDQVIEFLEGVDPDAAEVAEERYSCFRRYQPNWFMYSGTSHDQKIQCSDDLYSVYEDMINQQDIYETVSTSEELSFALLSAQLVAHFEEPYRVGKEMILYQTANLRNAAESIRWLVEEGGNDSKVIIWTDNIAIADVESSSSGFPVSLGHYLKNYYGEDILTIGFAFNAGEVNARSIEIGNPIVTHQVPPPPEGSFGWIAPCPRGARAARAHRRSRGIWQSASPSPPPPRDP